MKKRSEIAAKAAAEGKSAKDAAQAAAQGTKDDTEEDTKPAEKKPSSRSVAQETTVTGTYVNPLSMQVTLWTFSVVSAEPQCE